jgi:tungstate transport system substrate-binding protein
MLFWDVGGKRMPQHHYTSMQIFIICVLVFVLGIKIQRQYPEWFNGVGSNSKLQIRRIQSGINQIGNEKVAERFVTLGSATSPQDAGFLDYIIPIFRTATGLDVQVESVGTGRALSLGARRNVDALLVHDRAGENLFIADGYGVDRRDVMYDDFVIVGPSTDPASIRGLNDARKAFVAIAAKGVLFASRGDDGGTYRVEIRLWKLAGVEPVGQTWYPDLDQGIGPTLNFAAALNAYTLTDRAAWANFKNRQNLEILVDGDPVLFNPYSSILVNPTMRPRVKYEEARTWHEWLTSKAGITAIASYRINGKELFFPRRS